MVSTAPVRCCRREPWPRLLQAPIGAALLREHAFQGRQPTSWGPPNGLPNVAYFGCGNSGGGA